jgi:SAM-dependent methyltransferase
MPTIDWNTRLWNTEFDWSSAGEEWSEVWGGSEAQWFGSLYPRLHRFLPAGAVLEIAPGFGRWTKFLLPACERYVGIDMSAKCVSACRATFAKAANAQFFENDGFSLAAASDGAFDLIFSFDSLVHAETDVLDRYVPQILEKLSPTGVAFIHHANMGEPASNRPNPHNRALSVSSCSVKSAVERAGGKVLIQEQINWGGSELIDGLTLFAKSGRPGPAITIEISNPNFMAEADMIRNAQRPYSCV